MLRSLIRWAMRTGIAKAYDAYLYIVDLPRIIANRSPDYSKIVAKLDSCCKDRLAVIAPHPTKTLDFSLRNLISALIESGCTVVILTCDEKAIGWAEREFRDVYLAQRNLHGRDFGAWKYFILAILGSATLRARVQRFVLANDSMYFNMRGTREIIRFLAGSQRDWACTYENYEHHYHAQSFLLSFSGGVLNSAEFEAFWARYKPFSSRPHSIDNGEVKLSSVMKKKFGMPDCYMSSERLWEAMRAMSAEQTVSAISVLDQCRWATPDQYLQILRIVGAAPSDRGTVIMADARNFDLAKLMTWNMVVKLMETKNPTQSVGLLGNQLLMIPLKRDLSMRGTYHISHLLRYCNGYSAEESAAIGEDLREKGLPESRRGIKRFLLNVGRI